MRLRSCWEEARWGLSAYRGTAVLLVAAGAAAIVACLPVSALMSSRWFVPALVPASSTASTTSFGLDWGPHAVSAAELHWAGAVALFRLLAGVTAGVLAVAGLTALSIGAARGTARAGELTVRRAVGATRRRLALVASLESATLIVAALIVGSAIGVAVVALARGAWTGRIADVAVLPSALGIGIALLGMLLGAFVPLTFIRRPGPLTDVGTPPLALAIPIAQLGLGLTVLTVAGLLGRQASQLTAPQPTDGVSGTVFQFATRAGSRVQRSRGYERLLVQLHRSKEGAPMSLVSPGTITGFGPEDVAVAKCGQCWVFGGGMAVPMPLWPVRAAHYAVSADTFRALHLTILTGRGITDADRWGTAPVAVVSATLAREHFQNGRAVGRTIRIGYGASQRWYRVVGVVPDRTTHALGSGFTVPDAIYLSVLQVPPASVSLLVNDSARAHAALRAVRTLVGTDAGGITRTSVAAMIATDAAPVVWFTRMFDGEGWLMLLIAAIGAFTVM
ncbi:MAG TPA: ABC transporter permease, partial [Gemmatimonadales bacterium]|nr:ABC transporter permease [Gemmatimonadales bacterium]